MNEASQLDFLRRGLDIEDAPFMDYASARATAAKDFALQPFHEKIGAGIGAAIDSPAAFGSEVTKQLGGKYGAMAAAAPLAMAGVQSLYKPQALPNQAAADKGTIRPYWYTPGRVKIGRAHV